MIKLVKYPVFPDSETTTQTRKQGVTRYIPLRLASFLESLEYMFGRQIEQSRCKFIEKHPAMRLYGASCTENTSHVYHTITDEQVLNTLLTTISHMSRYWSATVVLFSLMMCIRALLVNTVLLLYHVTVGCGLASTQTDMTILSSACLIDGLSTNFGAWPSL